jgi:hypothetical protein
MQALRIDPNMLAYEAIWGPYDWNRFPLAPLGCKAIGVHMIGTVFPWHPWGVRRSFTNPPTHKDCGVAMELTRGTSAHR